MARAEPQAPAAMAGGTGNRPAVIRTGRGLTIAGTRITIYQILDYLNAGWSPDQIQYLHRLTDAQIAGLLAYIENHQAEVESEYQLVLRRAEEVRAYWEDRNRAQPAATAERSARPERAALRAQLEAWKKRLPRDR